MMEPCNIARVNYHWWGNILHWYDHQIYGFIEQYLWLRTVKPSGTVSRLDGYISGGMHPRWQNPRAWHEKRLNELQRVQRMLEKLEESL
mgnify:CR=1 FL=1